jgi:hypothetical protein
MLIVLNGASASLTPLTTTANAQTNHKLLTFRSCYQPYEALGMFQLRLRQLDSLAVSGLD